MHCAKKWFDERLPMLREVISVTKYEKGILFVECAHVVALQECQAVLADLRGFLMKETAVQLEEIRATQA